MCARMARGVGCRYSTVKRGAAGARRGAPRCLVPPSPPRRGFLPVNEVCTQIGTLPYRRACVRNSGCRQGILDDRSCPGFFCVPHTRDCNPKVDADGSEVRNCEGMYGAAAWARRGVSPPDSPRQMWRRTKAPCRDDARPTDVVEEEGAFLHRVSVGPR